MDADKGPSVEIYLRLLDCQICGSEINPDREEYIGRKRVCRRCYDALTSGKDREARKAKFRNRGAMNGSSDGNSSVLRMWGC